MNKYNKCSYVLHMWIKCVNSIWHGIWYHANIKKKDSTQSYPIPSPDMACLNFNHSFQCPVQFYNGYFYLIAPTHLAATKRVSTCQARMSQHMEPNSGYFSRQKQVINFPTKEQFEISIYQRGRCKPRHMWSVRGPELVRPVRFILPECHYSSM